MAHNLGQPCTIFVYLVAARERLPHELLAQHSARAEDGEGRHLGRAAAARCVRPLITACWQPRCADHAARLYAGRPLSISPVTLRFRRSELAFGGTASCAVTVSPAAMCTYRGVIRSRMSRRCAAPPFYTRLPITFSRCVSKVALGYHPGHHRVVGAAGLEQVSELALPREVVGAPAVDAVAVQRREEEVGDAPGVRSQCRFRNTEAPNMIAIPV